MAVDMIDDDTMAAVKARWKEDQTLRGLIPEPQAGKLKTPQAALYCHLEVKLDHRECAGTGTGGGIPWHDYRLVTLTFVGIKARVVEAVGTALAVFHQRVELTYPSGASFRQWWPVEEGALTEDPDRKEGQDIWRGIIQGRVWSIRVSGS